MLPNFFVVGAQKSGTSSLHAYLAVHPDIYLPPEKETKFFVDDARYAKGLEYYEDNWFSGARSGQLVGEVDPDYMYFDVALDRIAEAIEIGRTKFLFVFREPVSRAFSHYLMSYRRGIETLSFEEAIAAEPERVKRGYYERMHFSYLVRGFYYRQVMRFFERVNRDQVMFVLSDDLAQETDTVMDEVFRFLGVDNHAPAAQRERHYTATLPKSVRLTRTVKSKGVHKELLKLLLPFPSLRKKIRQGLLDWNQSSAIEIKLNDETREQLKTIYKEENDKLSELIDRDLGHWL